MIAPKLLARSAAVLAALALTTVALASSDVAADRAAPRATPTSVAPAPAAQAAPAAPQADCACHARR